MGLNFLGDPPFRCAHNRKWIVPRAFSFLGNQTSMLQTWRFCTQIHFWNFCNFCQHFSCFVLLQVLYKWPKNILIQLFHQLTAKDSNFACYWTNALQCVLLQEAIRLVSVCLTFLFCLLAASIPALRFQLVPFVVPPNVLVNCHSFNALIPGMCCLPYIIKVCDVTLGFINNDFITLLLYD